MEAAHLQGSMSFFEAVVLGITEGLTEFLPVSSTGHLILASRLLGMDQNPTKMAAADAYSICIQAGAILAVVVLYQPRLRLMFEGLKGSNPQGMKLLVRLGLSFFPAAAAGLLLNRMIKDMLFGIWPVVASWFIGGVFILAVSRSWQSNHKSEGNGIEDLSLGNAFVIGLLQCVAMWPGTSRSLMAILGGRLAGLRMEAAVEYSFLLGLVTLGAATVYEFMKSYHLILTTFGVTGPLIGFVTSFVSAVISVKWMIGYINQYGLAVFGWYRIFLACVVGTLAWYGFFASLP